MTTYNWDDYLTLARSLAARSRDDASLRSAISRAYYAVYGTARQFLRRKQVSAELVGQHKQLWNWFENRSDFRARQIGVTGNRLRIRRNKADYDDVVLGLGPTARLSVQEGNAILSALKSLNVKTT